MRKIIANGLIFILICVAITGCSSFNKETSLTSRTGAASSTKESVPKQNEELKPGQVSDLEKLKNDSQIQDYFYQRYENLASKKFKTIGEEDAARLVVNKAAMHEIPDFITILSFQDDKYRRVKYFLARLLYSRLIAAQEATTDTDENGNLTTVDYRVRFQGYPDILLSLKEQKFCFEGGKTVYTLPNANEKGDIQWLEKSKEKGEDLFSDAGLCSVDTDLDGDQDSDHAVLLYHGGLKLLINQQNCLKEDNSFFSASDSLESSYMHYRVKLDTLASKDGKKVLIFSESCATNKVGSTAAFRVFAYQREKIKELPYEEPKVKAKYDGAGTISMEVPRFGVGAKKSMTNDLFENYQNETARLRTIFKEEIVHHTLTCEKTEDILEGGDAFKTERLAYIGPYIFLCHLYTYYKVENGKLFPYRVEIFT